MCCIKLVQQCCLLFWVHLCPLPDWCEATYNLDVVVTALHNARVRGTSKGQGRLGSDLGCSVKFHAYFHEAYVTTRLETDQFIAFDMYTDSLIDTSQSSSWCDMFNWVLLEKGTLYFGLWKLITAQGCTMTSVKGSLKKLIKQRSTPQVIIQCTSIN